MKLTKILIVTCLLLASCAPVAAPVMPEHTYTSWAGRWTGVEGTYLQISNTTPRHYAIIISDLDGPRQFEGEDREHGIAFTRNGREEQLHKGNGDETGMKWLAGKQDCLYTHAGEGWCRD